MEAIGPQKAWAMGEFDDSTQLLAATAKARDEKLGFLDTHTAYPVHGIEQALGTKRSLVSRVALFGGIAGVAAAYGLQLVFNAVDTPSSMAINIANKPPHSPIVYIPVTFELMVLLAALSIVGSLIVYFWGFPKPYHPLFDHAPFINATTTGWWLSVETDTKEQADAAKARLEALGAKNTAVVQERDE